MNGPSRVGNGIALLACAVMTLFASAAFGAVFVSFDDGQAGVTAVVLVLVTVALGLGGVHQLIADNETPTAGDERPETDDPTSYITDPAERIAHVAEVAPDYVAPADEQRRS